ncbi:helix-turn-helix domain-containing protein [Streptosporangium sp. NPDC048047]|uniref:helix-turn-helix domain-containing protein n=1 Tax=Streptosporangium sp. NPDC048047 TaxID=3155748 RepID=UPI003426B588
MSDAQKRELWDRWKAGESISQIARALDKPPGSVFTVVKSNGGYVPPLRPKRPGTLSFAEREEIFRGLARGESMRSIAVGWAGTPRPSAGRSPATRALPAIGPLTPKTAPGHAPDGSRRACWRAIRRCETWSPRNWLRTGRPSRSPGIWPRSTGRKRGWLCR